MRPEQRRLRGEQCWNTVTSRSQFYVAVNSCSSKAACQRGGGVGQHLWCKKKKEKKAQAQRLRSKGAPKGRVTTHWHRRWHVHRSVHGWGTSVPGDIFLLWSVARGPRTQAKNCEQNQCLWDTSRKLYCVKRTFQNQIILRVCRSSNLPPLCNICENIKPPIKTVTNVIQSWMESQREFTIFGICPQFHLKRKCVEKMSLLGNKLEFCNDF